MYTSNVFLVILHKIQQYELCNFTILQNIVKK